jgi:sec-independent protein translocase protein TatA
MSSSMCGILALGAPGPLEWVIILVVAVLIFGKRLPEVGRGLGKSLVEFKKGLSEAHSIGNEVKQEVQEIKEEVVNQTKEGIGLGAASSHGDAKKC